MKGKLITLIVILICILVGVLLALNIAPTPTQSALIQQAPATPTTLLSPTPQEIEEIANPVQLRIPTLSVDAPVEPVGLDNLGRMAVPTNWYGVGWYQFGPKPGERGNAVMDGHYDTPTGDPNIFYNLESLSHGERIIVTDETGKEIQFEVTRVERYDLATIPLEEIFNAQSGISGLNLITCAGTWTGNDYTERVVVYSERVNE